MSKLFVTVLGTNTYFDCYYCKGDESYRTPFVQEALINFLYQDQTFDMKILLTEKAKQNNYYGKGKLKEILEGYNITPELVPIPEGKNADELWDIFDQISNEIDKSANKLCEDKSSLDVTIDITHSLRNIPMQIVVAMNYLTLFNNINLEGIYYGAYDLGETKIDDKLFSNKDILDKLYNAKNINNDILDKLKLANSDEDLDENTKNEIFANFRDYKGCTIKHAPICNLDTYYDLLKWTNAINSFIKCGNTNEIKQLAHTEKIKAFKFGTKEDKKNMELIGNVVESLNKFTNCINTCRGMYGKKAKEPLNSIRSASDSLCKSLQKLDENVTIKPPLKKLFKLVEKKIEPFINKNVLETGIATVNWCIDYNLYQQAYTALEETTKTLLCVKLNLPPTTDGLEAENSYINREDISNTILGGAYHDNAESVIIDESLNLESKNLIYDSINKLIIQKNFYGFIKKVKAYRNDLNHFGFNKTGAIKYSDLAKNIKSLRDELVKYSEGEFPWMEVEEEKQN